MTTLFDNTEALRQAKLEMRQWSGNKAMVDTKSAAALRRLQGRNNLEVAHMWRKAGEMNLAVSAAKCARLQFTIARAWDRAAKLDSKSDGQ